MARQFTADAKRKFEELRRGRAVSSAELTAVAQRVLREELRHNLELVKQAQGAGNELAALLEALDAAADVWRQAMPGEKDADGTRWSPLWSREADNYVAKVVKQHALPIDPGSAQYHELAAKIARAMVQAYTVPIRRLEGDYAAQPWDDLNDLIAGVTSRDRSDPRRAISGGPLLSEMFEKWLREQAGRWSPQTAADYRIGIDLFKEVAGDLPVGAIRRDDMRAVRQLFPAGAAEQSEQGQPLPVVPALAWQLVEPQRKTNVQLLDVPRLPFLGNGFGVMNAHPRGLVALQQTFLDAEVERPLDRLQVPVDGRRLQRRSAASAAISRAGRPRYCFSFRQPAAKLKVQDVRPIEGMLCLDIRWTGDGGRLKTKSAERYVPVHGSLLVLGLAEYAAAAARRGGDEMLWPHLKQGTRGWGSNFGKWFTREKRNAGITDPKLDFHSFRSTVIDVLLNKGVPLHDVKALVGHSQGKDVTQTSYRKSFRVAFMRQIVDRIAFDGLRLPG